uniref:HMG box domain-containing protein n=2 Tax=Mesocestoides corti TaxID=53468 RepID=A0A5K3FN75_MESCO
TPSKPKIQDDRNERKTSSRHNLPSNQNQISPAFASPVAFVEMWRKPMEYKMKLCENTRSVVEQEFLEALKRTPTRALLKALRRQLLVSVEDLPPVPAWKKVRGPPRSLKVDEETEPIRAVLLRLPGEQPHSKTNGELATETQRASDSTANNRGPPMAGIDGWFDVEDLCKHFNLLRIFFNPETLAYSETINGVKSTPNQVACSDENFIFVDSLDEVEMIIDFQSLHLLSSSTGLINSDAPQQQDHGKLVIEPATWLLPHRTAPTKTLSTGAHISTPLRLQPGRHCFRIFVETPMAFALHIFVPSANRERTKFVIGPIDVCLPATTTQPLRLIDSGQKLLETFCKVAKTLLEIIEKELAAEEEDDVTSPHYYEEVRNSLTHCARELFPGISTRELEKAIYRNLSNSISRHQDKSEPLDAEFAWKALLRDPYAVLGTELSSLETHQQEQCSAGDEKEVSGEVLRGLVTIQAAFRGRWTRRILRAGKCPLPALRQSDPSDLDRASREMRRLLVCLKEPSDAEMAILIRGILQQLGCPHPQDDANFVATTTHEGALRNTGDSPIGRICTSPLPHTQSATEKHHLGLLFHQTFAVPTPSDGLVQMRTLLDVHQGIPSLFVVNNDSGNVEEVRLGKWNDFSQPFASNSFGYTLVGLLPESTPGTKWKLSFLEEGWRGTRSGLVFSAIRTQFSFWELTGPFEGNPDGLLFRYDLQITTRQVVTATLKLSGHSTPAILVVRSEHGEVLHVSKERPGEAVLPAFLLGPQWKKQVDVEDALDVVSEAALGDESSATPSQAIDSSRASKKPKSMPAQSREFATEAELKSTTAHGDDQSITYTIEAYAKTEKWPLNEEERQFIAKIKEARSNELKVDFEEASLAPADAERQKASAKRKSPGRKEIHEVTKSPSWTCRIYCDSTNQDTVRLKPHGPTASELRSLKRTWFANKGGNRLEEGVEIRQASISARQLSDTCNQGSIKSVVPPPSYDEEEFAEFQSIFNNDREETGSTSHVEPSTAAKFETHDLHLKHCTEETIQRDIEHMVELSAKNQVGALKLREQFINLSTPTIKEAQ